MVNLLWRFIGDLNPLKKSFNESERAAEKSGSAAGKAFGGQFKSAVMRFIGAGAVISQVQKLMQESVRIQGEAMREGLGVEQMQELQRAAELTGMTIEELRKAAPEIAGPFTDMMNAIRESGGFLDAATVNQLSDAAFTLRGFVRDLAPLVGGLMRGLNWIVNTTKSGAASASRDIFRGLASITTGDTSRLFTERANGAQSDAAEFFRNRTGAFTERSSEREAVSGFMGTLNARRQQRAAFAGAMVNAMPAMETAIGAASRGVPFFGKIGEDMLKELQKNREQLKELSNIVNQKL